MFQSAKSRLCWIAALIGAGMVSFTNLGKAPADLPDDSQGTIGEDNSVGVYVRDSSVAMQQMALARRMEQAGEWGKSADLYQEVLEKYPDRVIAAAVDDQQKITQYTSVTEAVRERICKWPPEGLDVYRARYEPEAAKLLDEAGTTDIGKLHQVFSLYFATDSGKTAGIALMDIYFEQGEYAAVMQIGRRLLQWHPNLTVQRPMVLYRVALAEKWCGEHVAAQRDLDELQNRFPQATGTIRGEDVVLADSLRVELSQPVKWAEGSLGDSWDTVGGDASRGKLVDSTLKPGARLYSLTLSQEAPSGIDPRIEEQLRKEASVQDQMGVRLGVMPAVDHGELFFQDNLCLYAVDVDSGAPLSGWLATWPNGVYKIPGGASAMPAGQQFCVSINDKYVTAVMDLPDRMAQLTRAPATPDTRLVCLDRHTGRELWTASARSLPENQGALPNLQLGSAPLIVGNNIYVLGHGGKGQPFQQFDDCYVLCFNIDNGQFRWASFIASSAGSAPAFTPDGQPVFTDAISHIAYAGGRLFVVTDLGAAAALDAYTGSILWLNIYRDEDATPVVEGPFGAIARASATDYPINSPPWVYNPALVQNGKVFIFPSDSKYIFVYDADTGKEIKRIWLSDFPDNMDAGRPDTLLGVNGDVLYLAGPVRAWCLPWKAYDHVANRMPSGGWASVDAGQPVRGRGFVTGDAVYLPTQSGLLRILLRNGMIDPRQGLFPKNGWELTQEGPGNVVVTKDHIIIAGDRTVAVYADIELARAKLDRQIQDSPDDPQPRLHYAEVMFVAGETAIAEQKLQEAFNLIGQSQGPEAEAMRARGFNDAMNFAERLVHKSGDPIDIGRFFVMAKAAAQTPLQQAKYRLAMAEFALADNDLTPAMELYQQILVDDSMRQVMVVDDVTSSLAPAAVVAEEAIGRIIQSPQGKVAYNAIEQQATAALAAARESNDAAKLEAVWRVYPNSQAGPVALMAAADAYEAESNWRGASLVLRRLLNKTPDESRGLILEAMARNYLRLPGRLDVAASRLALAAAAAPDDKLHRPMTLPDGSVLQDITLAQASEIVRKYSIKASNDALPDLRLPTSAQRSAYVMQMHRQLADPFGPPQTVGNLQSLVVPLEGYAREDRLLAWGEKTGVVVLSTDAATPISTSAQVTSAPLGAAWINDGLLVWTAESIFLLDPQNGKSTWQLPLSSLPVLDSTSDVASDAYSPRGPEGVINIGQVVAAPAAQPAPVEQIVQVIPIGDHFILETSLGRIAAIDNAKGQAAWQTRVSTHEVDRLFATEDFTVAKYQDDQNISLIVLNSATGELVGRQKFAMDATDTLVNVALAADGTLVYTLPDRLCILDLYDANSGPQGMDPKFSSPATIETASLFAGAAQPDQLIVRSGRAFAVTDQGKFVRIYSLDTAKPWEFQSPVENSGTDEPLSTDARGSPNVTLHISGDYLYVQSAQNLEAYQIDHPWLNWHTPAPVRSTRDFSQILFGRDYLLVIDRQHPPLTSSNKDGSRALVYGFSRAIVKNRLDAESGAWAYTREVSETSEITAWQAIDGGVAYFSDNTVHILPGLREKLAASAH
jgi:outer membrane protein assembly factor BamB